MRITLIVVSLFFAYALKAQEILPGGSQVLANSFDHYNNLRDSAVHKKWFISSYSGISTGYSFFNHNYAGVIAAPLGLQLNRRLSNNLYAFAGVTVAPAYVNFNHAFLNPDFNKTNTGNFFYQPGNFSMYSAATLGLMYINPEKTFSISGSISVERSSYPLYYNNNYNAKKTITPVYNP